MNEKEKPKIGLPSDEVIINNLQNNLDDTLTIQQPWRESEVNDNYALFEGNQWTKEGQDRQIANAMPIITINRTAPVIESICGFEVQNRLDIAYAPRLENPEQAKFSKEVMGNTVKYIEQNTEAHSQYSIAYKDMLICGIGALSTSIVYNNNYDGEVIVTREFPGFLFWDPTARAKNLLDANWIIKIRILDKEAIRQEYGIDDVGDIYNAGIDARIMEYFNAIMAVKTLGVIYEYQWRQKEPFYRVENPFKDMQSQFNDVNAQITMQSIIAQLAQKYKFNPQIDELFSVSDKSELNEVKQVIEALGLPCKYSEQKKYKYYRAVITANQIVESSENFSQTGFSIKFMTGQFSELTQNYYGLVRGVKDPQRMLNQAVSDYVGLLQSTPKGGVMIEYDAVDNIEEFRANYTKAREVTVFKPGALANGKVMPKPAALPPSGIIEMINYADAQIMQVCGVTPEFMGIMQSKEMNSGYLRQQIRQGLTPLAVYLDAKRACMKNQGELYMDCVKVLMENNASKLMQNVTGNIGIKELEALKMGVTAEYGTIISEVPASPDENKDTFDKLVELQLAMPNKDFTPLIIKFSPLPPDVVKDLEAIMAPPPPQPPDPVQTELLKSQIALQYANADKTKADALSLTLEAALKKKDLQYSDVKEKADIDLTVAKTMSELTKAATAKSEAINNRVSTLMQY